MAQQFETAQFLPAEAPRPDAGELFCYGRSVVHQEWPRMEDGTTGDTINPGRLALFRTLKVEPSTPSPRRPRTKVARPDVRS